MVELTLVIAILAVVSAVAIPRFSAAQNRGRVEAAARRLAADLELARATAIARGAEVRVVFDSAGDRWTLSGVPAPRGSGRDSTTDLRLPPYEVSLDTPLLDGASAITFNAWGRPSTGGTLTIRGGAASRAVNVHPVTGQAVAAWLEGPTPSGGGAGADSPSESHSHFGAGGGL